jgi:uncharacterized delta-60 repeat protein
MNYKLLLLLLVFAKGFSQNAVLDTTFGVNGKVTTSFSIGLSISEIRNIVLQSDGRIISSGYATTSFNNAFQDKIALTRYNIDGSLDLSFGFNGKVVNTEYYSSHSSGLKIQPDGKIIVVGQAQITNFNADKAIMLRYNTDGTLDTTFGINGVVNISEFGGNSGVLTDILIQSDNKILVSYLGGASDDIEVFRYNSNGTIDTLFGLNGIFKLNIGNNSLGQSNETTTSVALKSDGTIILAGYTDVNNDSEQYDTFIVSINSNGVLDTTFGTNGFIITNFYEVDLIRSLIINNVDSIFISGFSFDINNNSKIFLAKYSSSGILDSNFGTNGKVITQTSSTNMFDIASDIKLQSDGKILCVGQSGRGYNFNGGTSQPSDMLLLRYNTDGSLDTTFSPTGYVTTSFDNNIYNTGRSVAIQNDGNIVFGGSTLNLTTGQSFALARYTFDNLATNSFSDNENFKIAPNPAKNLLTISVDENQKIDEVSVVDCTGKIVYIQKTNSNKIDVSSLQNGIYFVKIVANNKLFQQKFIKE